MTGDGELQEGQFWESLQPTANQRLGEITVIVDHNKLQSDTWVSRVSDLGDLERKIAGFGWDVMLVFTKEWFDDSEAVLRAIEGRMSQPR